MSQRRVLGGVGKLKVSSLELAGYVHTGFESHRYWMDDVLVNYTLYSQFLRENQRFADVRLADLESTVHISPPYCKEQWWNWHTVGVNSGDHLPIFGLMGDNGISSTLQSSLFLFVILNVLKKAHIPDLGRDNFFFVFEPKRTPEVTKTMNQRFLYSTASFPGHIHPHMCICGPCRREDIGNSFQLSWTGCHLRIWDLFFLTG